MPTTRRHAVAVAVVVLLGGGLAGCGPDGGTPSLGTTSREVDAALLEPLTALGPCTSPPPAAADVGTVPGLYLPDGAVVTAASDTGPLTNVSGYVALTPIQLRVYYLELDLLDVEVLQTEDEIRESETLLSDGEHRTYVKAQAACAQGSAFVAIVTAEDSGVDVPALPSPTPVP